MSELQDIAYDLDHMSMDAFQFAADLAVKRHEFESGESVFRASDRISRLFFVTEGVVHLLRPIETGSSAIMQIARRGDWLAEASLFTNRYHCDAICIRETVLTSVSKSQLMARLEGDGERAMALAQWMAARLHELRQLHQIVRIRSAKLRVMRWLEWKCKAHSGRFVLESTWSEIAEGLGLTREALYRVLAELKRTGAIRIEGRTVNLKQHHSKRIYSAL